MSLSAAFAALEAVGLRRSGAKSWMARCPAHEDRKASLSVSEGDDGRLLLRCQAGCETTSVVQRLGITMSDLYPEKRQTGGGGLGQIVAEYDYRDESNALLYQVVRYEPKDFRQRKPGGPTGWESKLGDVRRVLYRLPQLVAAAPSAPVYIVEGEKDADRLAALGLVATTNVGGAGKWRPEYSGYLRGRSVVILPDNDDAGAAHATQVTKALTTIAVTVRVVRLPGVPAKGDVSDWLAAGGTAEKLASLVAREESQKVTQAFRAAPDRIQGERLERLQIGAGALSFGVAFLDHALGGIVNRDLILFGAKSGVGKTSLATRVALHNCSRGKRVHYFALEAEDREIERRMKFEILADEYYRTGFQRPPIRYLDWYMGRLDQELAYFDELADVALRTVLANLKTYYRLESFTTDDFCSQLVEIQDDTDLIVLDHLGYVDSEDENENRAYKRIVKTIRDKALRAGKPVIVVAHVRKTDRRYEALVPTLEDFQGSSEIFKVATKAVMLAPAYDLPNPQPFLWGTYMQVAKCRLDSSLTRFAAIVQYDARKNSYAEQYTIGRLTDGGRSFANLTGDEMPSWASPSPTA